jgi:hypothetical protein
MCSSEQLAKAELHGVPWQWESIGRGDMDVTTDAGISSGGGPVWIMVHADNSFERGRQKLKKLPVTAAYIKDRFTER